MKKEITVGIGCVLKVSDETAEQCLRLLEIWQNNNPGKYIEAERVLTETGHKIIFRIMRYKVPADEEEEKHEHDILTEKQ